jgi:hypothetical protein
MNVVLDDLILAPADPRACLDWNGDAVDEIGVCRPDPRIFHLDMDGSDDWSAGDLTTGPFGNATATPLSGR